MRNENWTLAKFFLSKKKQIFPWSDFTVVSYLNWTQALGLPFLFMFMVEIAIIAGFVTLNTGKCQGLFVSVKAVKHITVLAFKLCHVSQRGSLSCRWIYASGNMYFIVHMKLTLIQVVFHPVVSDACKEASISKTIFHRCWKVKASVHPDEVTFSFFHWGWNEDKIFGILFNLFFWLD